MKKNILCFIIGGILFGSIGVYAAITISANNVFYTSEKTTKTNVQDVLDELIDKSEYGDATASDIINGKTALVNGKQVTGSYDPASARIKLIATQGARNNDTSIYTRTISLASSGIDSSLFSSITVNNILVVPDDTSGSSSQNEEWTTGYATSRFRKEVEYSNGTISIRMYHSAAHNNSGGVQKYSTPAYKVYLDI